MTDETEDTVEEIAGTAVPYTGGVGLDVLLPSGWLTVQPGDVLDCDDADVDALRAHPDFDTPPVDPDPHRLAELTGPQLNDLIDSASLTVDKTLKVDERRDAVAEAFTADSTDTDMEDVTDAS